MRSISSRTSNTPAAALLPRNLAALKEIAFQSGEQPSASTLGKSLPSLCDADLARDVTAESSNRVETVEPGQYRARESARTIGATKWKLAHSCTLDHWCMITTSTFFHV